MLLRRISAHFRKQEWTAIGFDFLIVVAGVFIGIQVANWNDARRDAAAERTMLRELRASLTADAEIIQTTLSHYRRVSERVGPLLAHMQKGGRYAPALDQDFGVLYGFGPANFNRAAYESLKSQGLDLISDNKLRSHIARVYEQSYGNAQAAVDSELRVILDLLQPYFLTQFKDLRFRQSATPLDYEALLLDSKFLNIVDYRLQIVRQNNIPTAEATLADINTLIAALDQTLSAASNDQSE